MATINNISGSSYLPRLPQKNADELHPVLMGKNFPTILTKPSPEEAYITSGRPTRLSLELMAQLKAKGSV